MGLAAVGTGVTVGHATGSGDGARVGGIGGGSFMGTVFATRKLRVRRDLEHVFRFKAPKPPFRVETSVSPLPEAPAADFGPGVRPRTIAAQVYYSVTAR